MTATQNRPRPASPVRTSTPAPPSVRFTDEQFAQLLSRVQENSAAAPLRETAPTVPEKPLHTLSSRELAVALAESYSGHFERSRRSAA